MNRRSGMLSLRGDSSVIYALLVCSLFFLIGGLFGLIGSLSSESDFALFDGLSDSFSFNADGGVSEASFWRLFLSYFMFPFASFFLGVSALGVLFIPAVIMLRGFSLVYVFSVLLRIFGSEGFFFSLLVSVLPALISVPCLFVISMLALRSSCRIAMCVLGRDRRGVGMCVSAEYLLPTAVVAAVLFFTAAAEKIFVLRFADNILRAIL